MSAVKINESLWEALSDEEREAIPAYFNAKNLNQEDFSVIADPKTPVPRADCLIYSITENELHDLTDEELKCRIKYHMDASKGLDYCIDKYNNAALLVCCIFIIERYKQNISCLCELPDEVSAICDSILSQLKQNILQSENTKDSLYKITIGDIATRKLLHEKKLPLPIPMYAPPSLHPSPRLADSPLFITTQDYSMFDGTSWYCRFKGRCRYGNYYFPCNSCD